jgi:predicted phosphoribosyltransferase
MLGRDPPEEANMAWKDRQDAGRALAAALAGDRGRDAVVLGLPRGGVVLAAVVAEALGAPLDVRVAKKIGAPGWAELAVGAVTAGGTRVLNDEVLRQVLLPPGWLDRATAEAREVARAREAELRGLRPAEPLRGRVAILVDDGIATGMTMFAAVADVAREAPAEIVVAAPVAAPDTAAALARRVDRVVVLERPAGFQAVGQFYEDFGQVEEAEVRALLRGAAHGR